MTSVAVTTVPDWGSETAPDISEASPSAPVAGPGSWPSEKEQDLVWLIDRSIRRSGSADSSQPSCDPPPQRENTPRKRALFPRLCRSRSSLIQSSGSSDVVCFERKGEDRADFNKS